MTARLAAVIVASLLVASPVRAQTPTPPVVPASAPEQAVSAEPTLPSFASLFLDLGRDFRRLPSKGTALILGSAGAMALAVHPEDARIAGGIGDAEPLETFFETGEVAGDGAIQVGGAFATFAIAKIAKSPRAAAFGADLVRAQLMNAVLTEGVKLAVGRTRPSGGRYSFPSGHTSASFATAAVVARHFGWKAGVPAYGLAAYIGISRLHESKHYLSDVLFGAAVGMVSGRTVTIGRGAATFAVAPFAARGGGGVSFTLVGSR
jgi:membrane-associated phospholipid phosphatase